MGVTASAASTGFELRFDPLGATGRAFSFPCDARGQVDLNALSDRLRCDYLFARALIGRDFGRPAVRPQLH